MIIGRGGCVIKQMQSSTRCRIQIPPTAPPGSLYRIIGVSGAAAGAQQVKQMIETIVAEQSSQSVMSGVAFSNNNQYGQQAQPGQQGAYGQQQPGQQSYYGQQQQPAYGQQQQQAAYGQQAAAAGGKTDYSAEWAAYYAAQAAASGQGGTAAAAPAPAAAAVAAPAAAPAAAEQQPAHDAYYVVFWQYAAYYGEEAARKHYGAWSPPVGTPNPTPAAAAPSPAAPVATSQGDVQDSSVRKVSNLPAWMTNKQG
mmetsp:Transcript_41834/g.75352  ORF Transcript_41834/g.75352 Transcript_41834/m.75352 type:complete len:253 (+) Transcript_41834:487-1245(+)